MTHGLYPVGLLAAVVVGGTACTRVPRAPEPAAARGLQCPGGYAVTVRNNTPEAVDVWQPTQGQSGYVGTVSGLTTNDLPLTTGAAVEWRWPPENPPRYHGYTDVTLHVHCT